MRLWLADRMLRQRIDPETFFRDAYMWRFKKDADVRGDAGAFRDGKDPPPYVQEFVKDIQQKEDKNVPMQTMP